jgi:CRISPR-associated protein Csb2
MFALRVTYLMGRVYSAVFDDGDAKAEPEWPPHPSRLFSALVSAWGESGAEEQLRPALEWIEQQEPPTIHAGDCTKRKLVQAYVPVNDSRTLPEDRARKPRAFPSASLSNPDVYFVWCDNPPETIVPSLRAIIERTSSLGHSASLVEVVIAESVPSGSSTVWQPDSLGDVRMRVPSAGRLGDLNARYKRFEKDPSKIHRPSAGATRLYGRKPSAATLVPAQGVFDQMIVLRRCSGPAASLVSALSVTAALRGAVMSNGPQPPPEYISGHSPASTTERPTRSDHPHMSFVPLPFVGAPHADGEIKGVAALLPGSLSRAERDVCRRALAAIQTLRMPWGEWEVSMTDAEEHLKTLRPDIWCRPSTLWSTVTPFVFDRYPKDPYGPEAEAVVREAFVRVGLPEPCEIDLHYNPWHIGVPKASAFPPAPARPGKPKRYHCHVWARFGQPIRGSVVVGAGRFYGYGLFKSLAEGGNSR